MRHLQLTLLALVVAAAPAFAQQGRRVSFDRFGYRLVGIGQTVTATATVVDASRRPLPDAPIVWRTDHPDIATVSARGVIQARSVGNTRLWAISGKDSAVAPIVVITAGNSIEFIPALVRLDAAGARTPLRVELRNPYGAALANFSSSSACRSRNGRVATLGDNGQVLSRRTGITYIVCSGSGVADSVRVEVGQRPVTVVITDGIKTRMYVGDTTSARVWATNVAGEHIVDASPTWASHNPAVVIVDSVTGLSRAVGPGEATIIAQVAGISDSVRISVQARPVASSVRPDPIPPSVRDTARTTVIVAPPKPDTAVAQRPRAALDSARAADPRSRSVQRIGGKPVSVGATAHRMTHSSRLAQGVNESRAGLLLGAMASVAPSRTLLLASGFRAGTLTGDASDGDVKVTEINGQLTYWRNQWFGLRGGYTRRSESTDLVLHQWQFASATAVTRFAFPGGRMSTASAISLLPWGSFSGYVDNTGKTVGPNKTSFAFASSVELQTTLLRADITYDFENFAFPAVNGAARQDRFSSLRLRVGVQVGRD